MAIDQTPRKTALTPRDVRALALKVTVFVVVAGMMAVPIGLLFLPSLVASLVPQSGTAIDPARARQIVVERHQVLERVLDLAKRSPLPTSEDPACKALATELGALDLQFEKSDEGTWVRIAYSRGGFPETYETQLAWVPDATAARVNARRLRLGEDFQYLEQGWWWVFQ